MVAYFGEVSEVRARARVGVARSVTARPAAAMSAATSSAMVRHIVVTGWGVGMACPFDEGHSTAGVRCISDASDSIISVSAGQGGGRYWDRTSDPCRVKAVLSR